MKKYLSFAALCLTLSACTPADTAYCNRYGVYMGGPEYGKCVDYYHQQTEAFGADARVCSMQADQTYPPSLYDYGHSTFAPEFSPYGTHIAQVDIPPDAYHNAQVDHLRMRIIGPCMIAHGWNSPIDWQAGRHAVKLQKTPASAPLPWASSPAPTAAPADLPWLKK